jgi:hypothetical protein
MGRDLKGSLTGALIVDYGEEDDSGGDEGTS